MRNVYFTTLVIVVLSLGPATIVRAADTIYTPVMTGGGTGAGTVAILRCHVLNTASTTQNVSVNIFSFNGSNITQNPVSNSPLPPGTATVAQAPPPPGSTTGVVVGYCKVTGDGPPRSVLVSLCNSNRVGATDNCVAAVVGQSQGSGGF